MVYASSVWVPRKTKIVLCLAKKLFLKMLSNKSLGDFEIDQEPSLGWGWSLPSSSLGSIFLSGRFCLFHTHQWKLQSHPKDGSWLIWKSRMAHLKAFLQRKVIFPRRCTILASLGTLTDVVYAFTSVCKRGTNCRLRPVKRPKLRLWPPPILPQMRLGKKIIHAKFWASEVAGTFVRVR